MLRHSPAFATLKSADDAGRFSGLAWSFDYTPDRQGSVITPSALRRAAKSAPWPLLYCHKGDAIGTVESAHVTEQGLEIDGVINTATPVYRDVKSGSVRGLSIGFRMPEEGRELSGPVEVITALEMMEVSICHVPVNAGAHVAAVKSWRQLESEIELQHLLKSTGMPGRLAQKCAAAAWPVIQKSADDDAAITAALRRIANL